MADQNNNDDDPSEDAKYAHLPAHPEWKPKPALRHYTEVARGNPKNVPSLPFAYFLKKSGNLVKVAIASTRNIKDAINPQAYMTYAFRSCVRGGMIPWEYQYAIQYAPRVVAKSTAANEAEWIKWRDAEQVRRMAVHKKQAAKLEKVYNNSEWVAKKTTDALEKLTGELIGAMKETRGRKAKGSADES